MTTMSFSCAQALFSVIRSHCESGVEQTEQEVFVDFENANPTEIEREVYELTEKVRIQAQAVLDDFSDYGKGASDVIRLAIQNSNDGRYQEDAWCSLLKLVKRLRNYYELSIRLEQVFPLLLRELCSGPLSPGERMESRQALTKQLAEMLNFVFLFDELKMNTPAVQNDFSYYRRSLSRQSMGCGVVPATKMNNDDNNDKDVVVSLDMATSISFFYANHRPMLTTLTQTTCQFVTSHPDLTLENTTDTLASMAAVCRSMVETPEYVSRMCRERETRLFCLRVMVGSIILYDHVHPNGAFARNSSIDIRAAVRVLKNECQAQPENVANLLNALRYTSKHLNDATTPRAVKSMLL